MMNQVQQFLDIANVEQNQTSIDLYRDLLREETCEFWTAWAKRDRVEMLDGIADVMFVNWALYHLDWHINGSDVDNYHNTGDAVDSIVTASGFSVDEAQEACHIVYASNLSKFDDNERDAHTTALKYMHLGIDTNQRKCMTTGKYATFSAHDQLGSDCKTYQRGKLLKSAVNYFKPDFSDIL